MIKSNKPLPAVGELFSDTFAGEDTYITVTFADTREVCYDAGTRRLTDEKYILTVLPSEKGLRAEILCSGEKSALYAFADLFERLQTGNAAAGTYVCAPKFAVRGYIEGFYGAPWTQEQRLDMMAQMAKKRMNAVYYAPKDDPYHRELWRESYPADRLAGLKELVSTARRYAMDFVWCVAPGLSVCYANEDDFAALINKTRQLYQIGVRAFGLLLDDIDEELIFDADKVRYGETVNAHIDLVSRYDNALRALDARVRLTVCPMQYHGRGDEYYISKLGLGIPADVSLFFTGRDICSRDLTSAEALRFAEHTRHKPLYWDNYPVNDMAMRREMHLSPVINREADLYKYAKGIIFNCMAYAACSVIPLSTGADYLWDAEGYAPEASFERAVKQAVGKENAGSFLLFADHLYVSCLLDENSRRMKGTFTAMRGALAAGEPERACSIGETYLAGLLQARSFLQGDHPLCRELAPWTEKFELYCEIIKTALACLRSGDPAQNSRFYELLAKYESMPARFADPMDIEEAYDALRPL